MIPRMRRFIVPAAPLSVALAALLAPAVARADAPPQPDFAEIARLAQTYRSMRYDELPTIHANLDPLYDDVTAVDLAATQNRYRLATKIAARRHEVWIRGTVNRQNAFTDLEFRKGRDPRLGINLHRGFMSYATAVYDDLAPRLTDAEGARKFAALPVLRIINEGDPVPPAAAPRARVAH